MFRGWKDEKSAKESEKEWHSKEEANQQSVVSQKREDKSVLRKGCDQLGQILLGYVE